MAIRNVLLNHSIFPHAILYPSPAEFFGSIAFSEHCCMRNAELSPFNSSAQGAERAPIANWSGYKTGLV